MNIIRPNGSAGKIHPFEQMLIGLFRGQFSTLSPDAQAAKAAALAAVVVAGCQKHGFGVMHQTDLLQIAQEQKFKESELEGAGTTKKEQMIIGAQMIAEKARDVILKENLIAIKEHQEPTAPEATTVIQYRTFLFCPGFGARKMAQLRAAQPAPAANDSAPKA